MHFEGVRYSHMAKVFDGLYIYKSQKKFSE